MGPDVGLILVFHQRTRCFEQGQVIAEVHKRIFGAHSAAGSFPQMICRIRGWYFKGNLRYLWYWDIWDLTLVSFLYFINELGAWRKPRCCWGSAGALLVHFLNWFGVSEADISKVTSDIYDTEIYGPTWVSFLYFINELGAWRKPRCLEEAQVLIAEVHLRHDHTIHAHPRTTQSWWD